MAKKGLQLYEYQKEALDAILKYKRGLVVLPTGAGKTIIGVALLRELLKTHTYVDYFVLVPTLALVTQWENVLLKYNVPFRYGAVLTYSSFIKLAERSQNVFGHMTLEQSVAGSGTRVNVILIDEAHHAHITTRLWDAVSKQDVDYLIGFTATPNPLRKYNMPVIYKKTIFELSRYLSRFILHDVPVKLDETNLKNFKDSVAKLGALNRQLASAIDRGDMEAAQTIDLRIKTLLTAIPFYISLDPNVILTTVSIASGLSGRTLIKTNRRAAAVQIKLGLIQAGVPGDKVLVYTDKRQITELYRGKWIYVITVKALSEGIDIPDITNVILSSYDYSYILSMVQAIGRALRKSLEKKRADIFVLVPDVPQYRRAYERLVAYMK